MAKRSTKDDASKVLVQNRRASFDYELGERYQAGVVLLGSEVKALRAGTADMTDAWISIDRGEAWLRNLTIQPWKFAIAYQHEPRRARKLLLHAREIAEIDEAISRDGQVAVPLKIVLEKGRIKCELALGTGRKKADKRQAIKTREADREARSAMARARKG